MLTAGSTCLLVVVRVCRDVRVTLPGGDLQIEWREADGRIYMTGPADLVFAGQVAAAA